MKRTTLRKPLYVAGIMLLLLGSGLTTSAGSRGWEYLGSAHVDGAADHDRIEINNGEQFRSLQIAVKGAAIDFQRVLVHFENGQDFDAPIRYHLRDGAKSRPIDLPGERRRIRSVEFWYGRGSWSGRTPSVNLWGLRW